MEMIFTVSGDVARMLLSVLTRAKACAVSWRQSLCRLLNSPTIMAIKKLALRIIFMAKKSPPSPTQTEIARAMGATPDIVDPQFAADSVVYDASSCQTPTLTVDECLTHNLESPTLGSDTSVSSDSENVCENRTSANERRSSTIDKAAPTTPCQLGLHLKSSMAPRDLFAVAARQAAFSSIRFKAD